MDLIEPLEIPESCIFLMADVLRIAPRNSASEIATYIWDEHGPFWEDFDFICASPPCEQFAVFGMRHFHPDPPYPELGIRLFNHTRSICEESGVPYILENVRRAQDFVGRSVHHCGPYHLWGTGVPPLMPQGINKGFGAWNREQILATGSSKSQKRQDTQKARAATIPPELVNCVADYAERLLEQKLIVTDGKPLASSDV